ncbi:putative glycosyl transferase [compost metagenome]
MIRDNQCGFAVAPESPQAFADALEQAASDRSAAKEMGKRGRELAEREFDRELLANRFVDWLEGVKR